MNKNSRADYFWYIFSDVIDTEMKNLWQILDYQLIPIVYRSYFDIKHVHAYPVIYHIIAS